MIIGEKVIQGMYIVLSVCLLLIVWSTFYTLSEPHWEKIVESQARPPLIIKGK